MTIPSEISSKFNTQEGRKNIIKLYGSSLNLFHGVNEDGETVLLSIRKDGMTLTTYQDNGWLRVNYYDENGCAEGETFDGRWK